MKKKLLSAIVFILCAVAAHVQADTLVVPRVNENLDGVATDGGGSGALRHAIRIQTVYGASQFATGTALRVTQIRLRPSAVWGNAFTSTIPDLQIKMSTTAARANNLSATFADNVGANETVVFQGPITLSSRFVGPAAGPKEFDIIIPLATSFTYDPAAGNLLVELRHASATGVANIDAGGAFNDDCSRAYAFTATAATADTRDKAAEVLQLVYEAVTPPPRAPRIVTQPASQTVNVGETVVFSVSASGTVPLEYQWRKNEVNIGGATQPSLVISNVQSADAGVYSVRVSNSAGSAVSSNATLTVISPPPPPPPPAGLTLVVPRINENLDGVATDGGGSGALTHPIRSQTVYGASQFPVGTALRITELRLRPSAVWGNAFTSTIPDLQIKMSTTAARANNLSATFADNVGANETVVFQGPITLSSRFVGPAAGPKEFDIIIPLATSFTYDPAAGNLLVELRHASATGVASIDAGGAFDDDCSRAYAFTATAGTADTRDKGAEVLQLVYDGVTPPPRAPRIVTQPASQTVNVGETVVFSVSASGTGPLEYQWRKNEINIGGATQQSLVISNVQSADAGVYSVRVSNSAGSAVSSNATLTVISPPPPPPPGGAYAVIPRTAEGVEQIFGSGTFDTAHRSQQVYGSVEFPQHPMLIHELRFRPDSVYGGAFTATVANIQINLSTTRRIPDALSATFAENVGADDTVVYQGALTVSSAFTGPSGGPKDFDIIVRLQRPYLYDPARGNLVIDTRNFSGSSALRLGGQSGPDVASRVLGGITALSGNPDSGADAIQLWFTRPFDSTTLVVPRINENLDGVATDGGGSGALTHAIRIQTVYGASQFPVGAALRITELRFRPSAVWGNAFTATIPDLQIKMSTTAARANNLSATFADNVGANETVVFQGPITLSSRFVGPAAGPKEFDIIIPLATSFTYDPAAGNLLVELRHASATGVASIDAGGAFNDDCSRAYAFTATAGTADTRDKGAEVLQLVFEHNEEPPNNAPTAKAVVSPVVDLSPKLTDLLVISVNGTTAAVTLDGAQSSDPEGAPLTYQWFADGSGAPIATGVTANVALPVGSHEITLAVSDGQNRDTDTVQVEVVTIHDVLNVLIGLVDEADLLRKNQRSLITALRQAQEAAEGERVQVAINRLESFQNKVAAQITPINAECAELLISAAQKVIDALGAAAP
jgi:hypothetical protein